MSKNTNKKKKINAKNRLVRIDMMVGMTMLLVVLGHMSVGAEPEWYSNGLHNWIYSFHMEMFVFLSAFLIRYSYKGVESILEYGKYIWRKFKKFFVWFLVIGLGVALLACVFKGKALTWSYITDSLRVMLTHPHRSEASFLWYIYILFGYYIISPLFFRLPQWFRVLCCVGALFLAMLEGGTFLAAHDFCQYTFFYCLGVLCAEWIEEIRSVKVWMWGLLSVPFIAYSAWLFGKAQFCGFEYPQLGWWTTVTGTAALPLFFLLSLAMEKIGIFRKAFTLISKDCYWIYLLQMFVIWGCVHLVAIVGIEKSLPFWIFLVIATILAIAIPIALAELTRRVLKSK